MAADYNKRIAPRNDVDLLFYSLDESEEEMLAFLKKGKATFPALSYAAAKGKQVRSLAKLEPDAVPSFFIVDKDGKKIGETDAMPTDADLARIMKK